MEKVTPHSENSSVQTYQLITKAYEEYHPAIISYISYKINNHTEAEDMAQDVFVRLLDYKQMLRTETVKSFIYTIARNLVIDYLRRHYKREEISANMIEFSKSYQDDIESKLYAKEILNLEVTKLRTFSSQRKKVYTLCRFEEKTVSEVSEMLQLSKRTVENHLLSSRKIMREYISQCV